jgi:hypothetical protein
MIFVCFKEDKNKIQDDPELNINFIHLIGHVQRKNRINTMIGHVEKPDSRIF